MRPSKFLGVYGVASSSLTFINYILVLFETFILKDLLSDDQMTFYLMVEVILHFSIGICPKVMATITSIYAEKFFESRKYMAAEFYYNYSLLILFFLQVAISAIVLGLAKVAFGDFFG